jgi:hypothetical protein
MQGGVFDDSKCVMCFASRFLNRRKSYNLYGKRIISTSRSLLGGSYPLNYHGACIRSVVLMLRGSPPSAIADHDGDQKLMWETQQKICNYFSCTS